MTPDQLAKVKRIHALALAKDGSERAAYLKEACAGDADVREEIESLLDAHDTMGRFLETPAPDRLERIAPPPLRAGARIGSYEIVRILGSGGSGTVYEALQESPHRVVALKVMGVGSGTRVGGQRFQDEAEILARFQHPGIATVFEAGVHEAGGRKFPWFAMEFVGSATPVTEYAAVERLGPRRRLELIVRICDAVHYGHQKGIIHRDLKPANVLVDETGRPKVIDFGIARLADADTGEQRELIGTLAYMSPEQCDPEKDVEVPSDVYALGVLLYELLTGRLPHEVGGAPITEAARRIREEAPAPARGLGGDLEAILAKALEKEPRSRYASASALADDIRRHLEHRPVEAHAPGLLYQLRKFARRQRVAFFSIAALLVVSLAAAIVSAWMTVEKERERAAAEFQAYVANLAAAASALRVDDVAEARDRLERAPEKLRNWEWRHLKGLLDQSVQTIVATHRNFTGAISPDGVLFAATGQKQIPAYLTVWDTATKRPLYTLKTKSVAPAALAFSPDHQLLAVGYGGGTPGRRVTGLEILDAATGARRTTMLGHESDVNAVAFSPDGKLLASASRDRTVRVWDVASGAEVRTLSGHEDRVITVVFDKKGERLASGGREGSIRIWKTSGELLHVLRGHEGSVEEVAFGPDGQRLASVSRDRTLRLWDLRTGKVFAVGRGHTQNVRSVAISPDGRVVATGSYDKSVRLWDAADGHLLAALRGHTNLVKKVAFVGGGSELISFSHDGTIKLWKVRRQQGVPSLHGHEDTVSAVAFSPDGKMLASGARNGTLRLWDPERRRPIIQLDRQPGAIDFLRFSSDGSLLWSRSVVSRAVRAWSVPAGRLVREIVAWEGIIAPDAAFERSYCGVGGKIRLRDSAGGNPVQWKAHEVDISALALGPKERLLASGTEAGDVSVWQLPDRRLLAGATPHSRRISAIAFSADGRWLASASWDGTVAILEARTLKNVATLRGHRERVYAVAFSGDGTRVVSGGGDGTVRLWDLPSGQQVLVLRGHLHDVQSLAFSPDGRRLASGGGTTEGRRSAVKLWEAPE